MPVQIFCARASFFYPLFILSCNIIGMKPKKISEQNTSQHFTDFLWNLWCVISIVGIWPRFIEPNLLLTTPLTLPIQKLPADLEGLKILQFSDLHISPSTTDFFIQSLIRKIKSLKPDLIVFTGDFLCYSKFGDKEKLRYLLTALSAPYGCYAVLGNHDYAKTISINSEGEYDIQENTSSLISKGFARLTAKTVLKKRTTERAKAVEPHAELISLIQETPFLLLNNETHFVSIKDSGLNISGLGEYTLGRCQPELAFRNYDYNYPGITLLHNPDAFPLLNAYPSDIVLSGHTHGGQVNLPWLWKKFTLLENMKYKKGLFHVGNKWLYVSRGVGSVMPFRWFAPPEIVTITLERAT